MDKALAVILLLLVGGCTFIIQSRSPGAEIDVEKTGRLDSDREYKRIEAQIPKVPEK